MDRIYAYAVSLAAIALVGWPLTQSLDRDGFPLSTYPMFARPRGRIGEVASALAVSAAGESAPVPPSYVANAEAMQAVSTLRRAVAAGPRTSLALCQTIAERVSRSSDAELRAAVRVEIVSGRVDAIDYLAERATPHSRRLHARCDVPHGQP
ncbi:MAG TPA: hypothetical protein VJR89_18410 [Polyangiales bacterium]|nr:hypothetical protein [Polyangiales bacterium]